MNAEHLTHRQLRVPDESPEPLAQLLERVQQALGEGRSGVDTIRWVHDSLAFLTELFAAFAIGALKPSGLIRVPWSSCSRRLQVSTGLRGSSLKPLWTGGRILTIRPMKAFVIPFFLPADFSRHARLPGDILVGWAWKAARSWVWSS